MQAALPNNMKHEAYLDGWRGMSILLLLAGHYSLLPFYTGRLGVECFFVLSGRLMAEILFVRRAPLDLFYWRRVTRIFPALWLFVLAMLFATTFLPNLAVDPWSALVALTFTINYFPTEGTTLGHVWSLCVEEHSYVVLSITAFLQRRLLIRPVPVLLILSLACALNGAIQTWIFHRDFNQVYWHSDVRMASVLISAALFLTFREKHVHSAIPIVAGVVGLAMSFLVPDPVRYTVGTFGLSLALATLPNAARLVRSLLSIPPLTTLGLWSFSLYLWQQPFAGKEPRLAFLLLAFLAAIFSYYVVETPARSFLNRLFSSDDKRSARHSA
ncbi:acyltransferase family protein [Bradyrhizobium yuanmingense]|uniref:acyltransferase family protein n=1 Tax=Bradyrhizobium yuanmingense TaxID=108015 RepID=UPI0012F9DF43|nr:acyltransferase [Bradyrhizobium yuanmingense]MVT53331.1 acyltransferase family protein [Bradyrhizobium yuanmingense]